MLSFDRIRIRILRIFENIDFFGEDEEDLVVRIASPEDGDPPGLSLAEVPDVAGPMVLSARQQ